MPEHSKNDRKQQKKQASRRRPEIQQQPPTVRDRCMKLGQVFEHLEQKRAANGGMLPYGSILEGLAELKELDISLSRDRFEELWKNQFLPCRAAFPNSPPEEAFSPFVVGRPKGRDIPPEVTDLIRQLYKKSDFQSVNYDNTFNAKARPVVVKAILHGVWNVYPVVVKSKLTPSCCSDQ